MENGNIEVKLNIKVTPNDIEDIMVTAIEGGINYWAGIDNSLPEWKEKSKDMAISEYAAKLLQDGKTVKFYDVQEDDDDSEWVLDKDKLLSGIAKHLPTRGKEVFVDASIDEWEIDTCQLDAEDADAIIQYALFNEIVYG